MFNVAAIFTALILTVIFVSGGLWYDSFFQVSHGYTQLPVNVPVQVFPKIVDFGTTSSNEATPPYPLTITNIGPLPLKFNTLVISPNFKVGPGCDEILKKGQSCQVPITFIPGEHNGLYRGSFKFSSNLSSKTITLVGRKSLAENNFSVSFYPPSLIVPLGSNYPISYDILLTNQSNVPIPISKLSFIGNDTFEITHSCPDLLAVQESCPVTLKFSKKITGENEENGEYLLQINGGAVTSPPFWVKLN